ncbi:heliorhodopsin HeR [Candidatus Saccharibacteria bacterium]|nr:heliorhodopsin HeR [Candidatus Saccharibacteria bacterium]
MATTKKSTTKSTAKKSVAKKTTKKATTSSKSVGASASKKTAQKKVTKKAPITKSAVATSKSSKSPANKPKSVKSKLNIWNWVMAGLHAAQGVAVIVLSQNGLFPVTTNYLTVDTIADAGAAPTLVPATRFLFDVNLAYLVAAFFFMSAIAHLVIATVYRKKYEANLDRGINKARWIEYGISASTMMVGIAMLSGVSDLSTLMMIFGGTLVMNLLGLLMEVHNQTTLRTSWLSFNIGTLAGILPWITVAVYFWGANQYGEGNIPTFVYYIYGSMFVFFSSFAVNMYLQYKKKGKWADYFYGEKTYMILSLVAKSLLAWQVFAGALRP